MLLSCEWTLAFWKNNNFYNSSMQLPTEHYYVWGIVISLVKIQLHDTYHQETQKIRNRLFSSNEATIHTRGLRKRSSHCMRKLNSDQSLPGPGLLLGMCFVSFPEPGKNAGIKNKHFIWILIGIRIRLNSGGNSLCLLALL